MTNVDWAEAIAVRISDEWVGKDDFPEDAQLLRVVLSGLLRSTPDLCNQLIGTGIIEEDYFEPLP